MTSTTTNQISIWGIIFGFSLIIAFAGLSPASAQLSHEGFDSPFVTADFDVFTTTTVDVWGAENAEVLTGPSDGIVPAEGDQMVKMPDNGLICVL